jgi:hypothetical protein
MTDQDERSHQRPAEGPTYVLSRALSVVAFSGSAALGLFGAAISAAEESYTSFGQPQAVAYLGMAGASAIAAGLALVRSGGVLEGMIGVALLLPAWVILNDSSPSIGSPSSREQWIAAIAAWGLVVSGGLMASGLPRRAFRGSG